MCVCVCLCVFETKPAFALVGCSMLGDIGPDASLAIHIVWHVLLIFFFSSFTWPRGIEIVALLMSGLHFVQSHGSCRMTVREEYELAEWQHDPPTLR